MGGELREPPTVIGRGMFETLVHGSGVLRTVVDGREVRLVMSTGLEFTIELRMSDAPEFTVTPSDNDRLLGITTLALMRSDEQPLSREIERRLWHVRQLHALLILLEAGRLQEFKSFVQSRPDGDLEALLFPEDMLELVGGGTGSWYVDVFKKAASAAKKSKDASLQTLSLIFADGRALLIRYVKAVTEIKEADARTREADAQTRGADARLREAEAALKEGEVEKMQRSAAKERLDALIETSNKIDEIKDAETRALFRQKFAEGLKGAVGPDVTPLDKLLPSPKKP